jgi:hypothetical protein
MVGWIACTDGYMNRYGRTVRQAGRQAEDQLLNYSIFYTSAV